MADDLRLLVAVATDAGWSPVSHRGGIRLRAFDSSKTIEVPRLRQFRRDRLLSLYHQVFRGANPEALEAVMAALETSRMKDLDPGLRADLLIMASPTSAKVITDHPVEAGEPTVTSVKPWLARRNDGMYESKAVNERTWSDGRVDYVCPRGDFANDNPRSVSSHFANTHSEGITPPGPPVAPRDDTYRPSQRQVRMLSHFMQQSLADMGQVLDVDVLAFDVLQWLHGRHELDGVEPQEETPLTEGEILARVRSLVVGEEYERLKAMAAERTGLAERLADAEARTAVAEASERTMRANLEALGELFEGLKGGGKRD